MNGTGATACSAAGRHDPSDGLLDLLALHLREVGNARLVAAPGEGVDADVPLARQQRHPPDTHGAPGIDVAVDEDHRQVVLTEELHRAPIEGVVELQRVVALGKHHPLHIPLGGLQGDPPAEGPEVVAVIAQLGARLHDERAVGALEGEIAGIDIVDQGVEHRRIVGQRRGEVQYRHAPLPEGEGQLQHTIVVDLVHGDAEGVAVRPAIVPEGGQQRLAPLQGHDLELSHRLADLGARHLVLDEADQAAVLVALAERSHIGNGEAHVAGEPHTVGEGRLSALADARRRPVAGVELSERLTDMVQVVAGVLHRQITPHRGMGRRLLEIAVLHGDNVGTQDLRHLVGVVLLEREVAVVAIGDEHRRTVPADMTDDDALLERAGIMMQGIHLLADAHDVLLGILRAHQLADTVDAGKGLEAGTDGRRTGPGREGEEAEEQQHGETGTY